MKTDPSFSFDVHSKQKYMYHWIKNYLLTTHKLIISNGLELKGKTLVDIGIGRGRPLAIYKALGIKKVIGFDLDESEAKYARQQAKRLKIQLKLVIDDFDNSKLKKIPSNSCEVVAFMDLLFFIPEKAKNTVIKEAKRILKPDGTLLVVELQKPTLMSFISFLSFKNWEFLSHDEFMKKIKPLKLIAQEESNYFYGINAIVNIFIAVFGAGIIVPLNNICRKIGINGSTRTYIFKK